MHTHKQIPNQVYIHTYIHTYNRPSFHHAMYVCTHIVVSLGNSLTRLHWVSLVGIGVKGDLQTLVLMCLCTFCHVADSWLLWYSPHHMTIVLPFKEATVPGLQPQGGLLREQEGLCMYPSRTASRENTSTHCTHIVCNADENQSTILLNHMVHVTGYT